MQPTITIKDKTFEVYIDAASIQNRIKTIAAQISETYHDKRPLFIAILNGSFMFVSDLMKNITIDAEITFVKLSSYAGMQSSGQITEAIGLQQDIRGRHVIVLEDIVDTGNTLYQYMPKLKDKEPASLALAVFLRKPTALKVPLEVDYTGFDIEDKFVVGYGMDYDELGRNIDAVYRLKEED